MYDLPKLANDLNDLANKEPEATLWDALSVIAASFEEASSDPSNSIAERHYANIAADAISDARSFIDEDNRVAKEVEGVIVHPPVELDAANDAPNEQGFFVNIDGEAILSVRMSFFHDEDRNGRTATIWNIDTMPLDPLDTPGGSQHATLVERTMPHEIPTVKDLDRDPGTTE
jgi:hypothetical protein